MAFKIFGGIMTAAFAIFAAVQYNDPDGLLWVAVYILAAAITLLALLGRPSIAAPLVGVAYLAAAFWIMPKEGGNWMNIETGREAMGLLVCAVWMGALTAHWYRHKNPGAPQSQPAEPESDRN